MKKLALLMGYAAAGLFAGTIQSQTKPTKKPMAKAARKIQAPQPKHHVLSRKWDSKKEEWYVLFSSETAPQKAHLDTITFAKSHELPTNAKRIGEHHYLDVANSWKKPESGSYVWVSKSHLKDAITKAIDNKHIDWDNHHDKWHPVIIEARGGYKVTLDRDATKLFAENFRKTGHIFGPKSGKDNQVKKEKEEETAS